MVLSIKYNGIPDSVSAFDQSQKFYEFYHTLSTFFIEWAKRHQHYLVREADKLSLENGKVNMLSEDTRLKFVLFLHSLLKEDTGNVSKPLLSELVKNIENRQLNSSTKKDKKIL